MSHNEINFDDADETKTLSVQRFVRPRLRKRLLLRQIILYKYYTVLSLSEV